VQVSRSSSSQFGWRLKTGDGIWMERRDRDDWNGTMGESAGDEGLDLSNPRRFAWAFGGSGKDVGISGQIRPKPALGPLGLELTGC
jgi:hypothetical protein